MPTVRDSSQPSSSEGSRVSEARAWATIWSAETPFWMSAPAVFFGWTPVRKQAAARAWSPGPSPSSLALWWARPLSTRMSWRKGSSGLRMRVNAKALPFLRGLPVRHDDAVRARRRRTGGRARVRARPPWRRPAAWRRAAGRASVAPAPRRNVRRGRCWREDGRHDGPPSPFRIWNGRLCTISSTRTEKR